jgi:hypothetical protein
VNQNGQWIDAPVQAATVQKLEEVILTKARAYAHGDCGLNIGLFFPFGLSEVEAFR